MIYRCLFYFSFIFQFLNFYLEFLYSSRRSFKFAIISSGNSSKLRSLYFSKHLQQNFSCNTLKLSFLWAYFEQFQIDKLLREHPYISNIEHLTPAFNGQYLIINSLQSSYLWLVSNLKAIAFILCLKQGIVLNL